jgi:predicted restriction endonuclease
VKVILPTLMVCKDELLEDLRRVSQKLGSDIIKRADYEEHGKYSYTTFRNHFGSWKVALEIAGLSRGRNWGATSEELLENIRDVWLKLGRQPNYSEMTIPFSRFSSSAYRHKFGSWTDVLLSFQKYLDQDGEIDTPQPLAETSSPTNQRRTKREPNWRLRFKVLQRDNFRCVGCGRSPAKEAGVELHIDHVKAWSRGGETTIENLQTLCKTCNIGKGNLE